MSENNKLPYYLRFDVPPARRPPVPPPPPPRVAKRNIFGDWKLADADNDAAAWKPVPVVNTRTAAASSFFATRAPSTFVAAPAAVPPQDQEAATDILPSEEQRAITDLLRGRKHNLVVNSIAGAGKTTTIVFAVQQMLADFQQQQQQQNAPPPTVHLITYNANLKLETRERLGALGLAECTHAHSYHSHAVHHLAPTCFDDQSLAAALRRRRADNETQLSRLPAAGLHLLFLDEVQDQTELYYRYLCTLLRDLASSSSSPSPYPPLCLLGDSRQCIFQFNGADERFLELAPQLLAFTGRPWAAPTLTTSYRLTRPLAAFVNHVMLQIPMDTKEEGSSSCSSAAPERDGVLRAAMGIGIRSERTQIQLPRTGQWVAAPKPRYLVCNAFGEEVYRELRYYLDMGYGPGDIFVVAPSVASAQSPIRRLENTLKQRMPHLQLFVTSGKEERLDKDVLEGKLVFATMHQTKGLGRPVVIVLCFDDSYFRFMARDLDPLRCANVLYVAATRSSAHLSLIQHNKNGPLPFLNMALLSTLATVRGVQPPPARDAAAAAGKGNTAIPASKLTEHIPPHVLETVRQSLRVTVVREAGPMLEVVGKTQQDKGVENVSAITGTAVPAFFELRRTGHMTIFRNLVDAKFEAKVAQMEHTTSCSAPSFSAAASSTMVAEDVLGGSVFDDDEDDDDDGDDDDAVVVREEEEEEAPKEERAQKEEAPLLADWEKPFHLSTICLARLSPAELLYIANCHNASESQFTHKVFQIKNYDWLSPGVLADCVARLDSLEIPGAARFERVLPETRNRVEMCGRSLVGSVDCIVESSSSSSAAAPGAPGCIYEFKCVSALTTEHLIQLALYMYMHNCARGSVTAASLWGGGRRATPIRGQLFNVLTGELWELANDPAVLEDMVRLLCDTKFGLKRRRTDAQFLETAKRVRAEVGVVEVGLPFVSPPAVEGEDEGEDEGEEDEEPKKRRRHEAASTVVLDAPGDLESPRRRSARLAAAQKLMQAFTAAQQQQQSRNDEW